MKGDIRGYGNPRSKAAVGCYQRCGSMKLTARDEDEAALLAMLAQILFPIGEMDTREPSCQLSLYRYLRRQVPNKGDFPKL